MGGIHITFLDILDIIFVAALMYELYLLIRRTNAISIFTGIIIVYVLWLVVRLLDMELLSVILGQLVGVGVIALIIVFQPEIRKFLFLLGERYSSRNHPFWSRFLGRVRSVSNEWPEQVAAAAVAMASTYTGALIVVARDNSLAEFAEKGVIIDAVVEQSLIETIFMDKSPLHDGAAIIAEGRLKAARCILPVSGRTALPAYFGTRHRAALGIAEVSDAVVIVVSEERGEISFVNGADIVTGIGGEKLTELLRETITN